MAKVILTGAKGMLGQAFSQVITSRHPQLELLALDHTQLDVCDRAAVLALEQQAPAFIVHCAANVNADYCETHPAECEDTQVGGTQNVAELARRTGARILCPQSFLIFDGLQEPITEDTLPSPLSAYGRCKWQAEQMLRSHVPAALVVRMGGFFGGGAADKNFVGKFVPHLRKLIESGTHSYAVGERVWQPSFTDDLAVNSLELLLSGREGVYNMASHGEASFLQLARACVELLGVSHRIEIPPAATAEVARNDTAQRPWRAIMVNRRLQAEGLDRQRPWRDALADYLSHPYFQNMFQGLTENAAPAL